jgi:predicted Zn finger-like uncharacterized protein
MIRTTCPNCRTAFDVAEALVGQKGKCSSCGSKFIITAPESEDSRIDGQTTQPMNSHDAPHDAPPVTKFPIGTIVLGTLITILTGIAVWWLQTPNIPAALNPWISFIGETHPLFVHFPVAWVSAVFVLSIIGGARNRHALHTLLWLNLLTCAVGIVAGQCSAADHGSGVLLTRHFYAGLAVGLFSWLALIFFMIREARPATSAWPYRLAVSGAVGAVVLAGHFGATITHGELLDHLPWKVVEKKVEAQNQIQNLSGAEPAEERTIVDAVILPIMQARCVSCHGAEKQKGKLRLDSYESLMAAGESGEHSFVAADLEKSDSLRRIALAADDDDHMPPAKKPQVDAVELEVLKWWVQAGADPKMKLKDASAPADLKEKLKTLATHPPKAA